MLETLTIRNVAVIDSAEIPFRSGLNILSGETGAGKSIIIEAISLILGSRANTELVRAGCEEAVVQGLFDITEIPWLRPRLERLGIALAGNELLIKRTIRRDGKHRIYVNGELATLTLLQELCEGLVDLCGQHEHQSLLKPNTQLELLDRYGGLSETTRGFSLTHQRFRSLSRERETLVSAEAERVRRADFLRFQIQELRDADLREGEDVELQAEKQLLQSAEARLQAADAVSRSLDGDEESLLDGLRSASQKVRQLSALDQAVRPVEEGLARALAELEEASLQLGRYARSIDLDPGRLEQVQERLALLADLRRKYGPTLREMLDRLNQLESENSELGQLEDRLEALQEELDATESLLRAQAKALSRSRSQVAEGLALSVTAELKDLKMGEARFQIDLQPRAELDEWNATGMDQIQYIVQTNRGDQARPLGKVASGGELSRLMLAIRRVIADRGGIGVYLFDEIDSGIGGQTAFEVGKKLKSVASYNQVICITHLPQVASFADHHMVVKKSTRGDHTLTEVVVLELPERREELARMLGGPKLTRKSLENAAELLEMAR